MILSQEYLDYVLEMQKYFDRFTDADRILKVQEEAGEAAEAYLRFAQRNPWKESVSAYDVAQELADVVLTAVVAMAHFGFNPDTMLQDQRRKMEGRVRDWVPGPL